MKKLLMALGVVVSAACAQAATVNWAVTGTEVEKSYTVYLLVGDIATTTWSSAADVANTAVASGSIEKDGRQYRASGTATDASLTKTTSFYYVIVSADSTKYAVSDLYAGSTYVYNQDASPPDPSPSVYPTFVTDGASYSSFSGSVPEPTSGLLMALGLAGLALRRKRA